VDGPGDGGDDDEPRRFGLARGTPRWIGPLWGAAGAALALGSLGLTGARRPGLALGAGAALATAFFRDPERDGPAVGILASADGVVCRVDRDVDGRARVATFMAVWDVHVNRAPVDGIVRSIEHRPGARRPAFRKDSDRNERMVWEIDTPAGDLRLVQIAGAFARRIVPYVDPPETIRRGERIGLIRFGSRVDVVLPAGIEPGVRVGERVRASVTRIDAPADPNR
jgi:phosphatidylserine decarboxylase